MDNQPMYAALDHTLLAYDLPYCYVWISGANGNVYSHHESADHCLCGKYIGEGLRYSSATNFVGKLKETGSSYLLIGVT